MWARILAICYLRLDEAGRYPQVIGLTWLVMCVTIAVCAGCMRLHAAESESIFIYVAFTTFCILAAALNVYLTWYYTREVWDDPRKSWLQQFRDTVVGPVSSLRNLRHEIDLGYCIFQLLVPGMAVGPCFAMPMANFFLPYLYKNALLVLLGRNMSGREAERFLEPLPVGLCWDYQGHASIPFSCGLTLFILLPSMWWTHMYLCGFCIFY